MKMTHIIALAALLAFCMPLMAQDNVMVHGFGSWGYGKTDGNEYFWADKDGAWDYYDFALNISANVSDNLRLSSQIYANSFITEEATVIDFAFAEYSFSDEFKIRAGKAKQPFGIYGDIKRVGTIRPFFNLPTSGYEHTFFVAAGFTGASVLGNLDLSNDWSLEYNLYAGSSTGEIIIADPTLKAYYYFGYIPYDDPADVNLNKIVDMAATDIVGGKLTLTPPVDGLTLSASYAQNSTLGVDSADGSTIFDTKVAATALSMQYEEEKTMLRAEYIHVHFSEGLELNYDVYWVEGGYMLTDDIQLVGRYEHTSGKSWGEDNPLAKMFMETFKDQRYNNEKAVGLNYLLSNNFIVKASYHMITGHLWAYPENGLVDYLDDTLNFDTNYLNIGVNFSF